MPWREDPLVETLRTKDDGHHEPAARRAFRGAIGRVGADFREGRGKRRGPSCSPARNPLLCLVSPVGLEPTAPRLKVSCSTT
jgi:hypothetical protein